MVIRSHLETSLLQLLEYIFKLYYYMALAASDPNTEILQFDWFISCQIFPVLSAQGGDSRKPCLCRIKIKIFDKIWGEGYYEQSRKGKVTMKSEVDVEILYEKTTELQTSLPFSSFAFVNYISVKPHKLLIDLACSVCTSEISDFRCCTGLESPRLSRFVLKDIVTTFH